ncbi:MAG: short-chain dehydrogenase [Bacteroidetes bacterium]|nr:MAG: short-chain dehydrogenase [Bacteroidota bacterium]
MNIIITGASKGIGYEIAKEFAKNKQNKITLISRDYERLINLKNECLNKGFESKIFTIKYDFNELNLQKQLLPKILKYFDKIDILINNAGVLVYKPFEEIDINEAKQMFNVNFFAASELIRVLLPYFTVDSHKHIINISSMGGFQGSVKFKGLSYYSASKAAIANLTECLAEEYKDRNISFNCLALGSVQTEMFKKAFPGVQASLKPKEMAKFIVDFAINGNEFFNGKVLPVSISTP